jgi:hypothetical protein
MSHQFMYPKVTPVRMGAAPRPAGRPVPAPPAAGPRRAA